MDPERVKAILKEGQRHLHFVISLYKIQLDEGRHFLHEHPQGARSWQDIHMRSCLVILGSIQLSLTSVNMDW